MNVSDYVVNVKKFDVAEGKWTKEKLSLKNLFKKP
jgi:hypothetical protein